MPLRDGEISSAGDLGTDLQGQPKTGPTIQVTGKMHVIIQLSKNHFTTFLPTLISGNDAHL